MIRIENKKDCCGCGACEQICPKRCISLIEDSQGFLYPEADASLCVECGLCERVCPAAKPNRSCETYHMYTVDDQLCHDRSDSEPLLAVAHGKLEDQPNASEPLEVLAAKNPDASVRKCSSSGGVFTLLAESVIDEGGVVFGAMFNDRLEVVHGFVETKEQLSKFRGSKYVQSRVGNCFREVEQFLKEGRKVLFSGTPCQVAGLRRFLNFRGLCFDNLLLVDIVCHGVPSPMVWRDYLSYLVTQGTNSNNSSYFIRHFSRLGIAQASLALRSAYRKGSIVNSSGNPCEEKTALSSDRTSVNFRDKSSGWCSYRVTIDGKSQPYQQNVFMAGFLQNYYLRPSCYSCPLKSNSPETASPAAGSPTMVSSVGSSKAKSSSVVDFPEMGSESDITLGDYWGIEKVHPEFYDDIGVSLVLVNTEKGSEAMSHLAVDSLKSDFASSLRKNPSIVSNPKFPAEYDDFWAAYKKEGVAAIGKFATTHSKTDVFKSRMKRFISKLVRKA